MSSKSTLFFFATAILSTQAFSQVQPLHLVGSAINLNVGDSVFNITNTRGEDVCVNTYVISPDQQVVSCCSTLMRAGTSQFASTRGSFINNTLTPGVPTAVSVHLSLSAPQSDRCEPFSPGTLLRSGLTGSVGPAPGSAVSPLITSNDSSELTRGTSLCQFIYSAGSGFGICGGFREVQTSTIPTLTVAPTASQLGQEITLSATVPSNGLSQLVSFKSGQRVIGFGSFESGTAILKTPSLPVGRSTITAVLSPVVSNGMRQTVSATPGAGFMRRDFAAGSQPSHLALADFNRDGFLDFAATSSSDNTVSVWLGDGQGNFTPASGSPIQLQKASPILAAFVNSGFPGPVFRWQDSTIVPFGIVDKTVDLVVGGLSSSGPLIPLLGGGAGQFGAVGNFFGNPTSLPNVTVWALANADYNGDGFDDLAVSADRTIYILLSNGNGTFTTAPGSPIAIARPGTGVVTSVRTGDFNGDGYADLVGILPDIDVTLAYVFLGDNTGRLTAAPGSPFTVGSNAGAGWIATGDFNQDGLDDFAVANQNSATLTVWLATPSGAFAQAPGSPINVGPFPTAYPVSMAVGDFDGDGRLDLITNDFPSGRSRVFLGNGNGSFTERQGGNVSGIFFSDTLVADFNGDGRTDVIGANSDRITVLLATGPAATVSAIAGSPQPTAAGTTFVINLQAKVQDSSGNPIAGAPVTFTAPTSNSSGAFANGTNSVTISSDSSGIAIATAFTANCVVGSYAVIATSGSATSASFSLTNTVGPIASLSPVSGSGQSTFTNASFANPLVISAKDSCGNSAASGTVTFTAPANGASATFAGGANTATVSISGGLATSPALTANSIAGGPYSVTASSGTATTTFSLTNTPRTTSTTTTLNLSPASSNPSILSQPVIPVATVTSTGPTAATGKVSFSFGSQLIGTAPLDSSGTATLTSLLLPTGTASLRATYIGDASHNPSTSASLPHTVRSLPATGFGVPVSSSAGVKPFSLIAADFNSDGVPDLAVQSDQPYSISVLLGNRNGTFTQAPNGIYSAPTGTALSYLTAADFNGDGFTDIAFASYTNSTRYDVIVWFGNGAGNFTPAPGLPTSVICSGGGLSVTAIGDCQVPLAISATDFNLDGLADLAIVNFGGNSVSILLGAGDGHFTSVSGSPFRVGSSPTAIAIGDFDLNGAPDLAVSNVLSGSVSVLFGDGRGGFTPLANPITTGGDPVALSSADFNGDGNPDIAVVTQNGHNVIVLLGNGQGAFSTAAGSPYSASGQPKSIVAADFNGDGASDLAVGYQGGGVELWLGDGTGRFARASYPSINGVTGVFAIAMADLNGDGRADLIVSDYSGSSILTLAALGGAASVTSVSGTPQTTTVGAAFAAPLKVKVVDANNNPLANVTVTFSISSTGAGLVPSTSAATTDSSGIATSATLTANTTAGTYIVNASVAGVNTPAQFTLINAPGPAALVVAVSGNNQNAVVNTPFAVPLVALITDAYGNPIAGIPTTFTTATTGPGASLSQSSTSTDASGRVSSSAVANSIAGGPYSVFISAGAISASPVFRLTNIVGAASGISIVSGTPQTTILGTGFGAPLVVVVRDNAGNPVSGATVTFAGPSTGAGVQPSVSTAVTNSSGIATSPALVPNGTAGSYTITASVRIGESSATSVNFSLTNISQLVLNSTCPANPQAGVSYLVPISASGGVTPYTWQLSGTPPAGINIGSSSGVIGGIATIAGSYPIVIRVTDNGIGALRQNQTLSCILTVTAAPPPPLSISGCPVGPLTIGENYSYALTASGGEANKSWIATGNWPGGLSIQGSIVSGIPTGPAGTYSYHLQVTSGAQTATSDCSFVVSPARLQLTSGCPGATGTVGVTYGPFALSATGGGGPSSYSYSPVNGSLPDGLNLTNGAISGTPQKPGTYNFAVQVASGSQTAQSPACSVVIASSPLEILGSCPISPQQVGNQVSASFTATGGQGQYTFAFLDQPSWLTPVANTISGMPKRGEEGDVRFRVVVSDSVGTTNSKECAFTVAPKPLPPTVPSIGGTCPASPQLLNSSINLQFTASGGETPYTWSATGVPGVTLTSTTGASNSLTGSLIQIGSFTLSVGLTDNAGQAAPPLVCPVRVDPPQLTITPSGACPASMFDFGAQFTQSFTAAGGIAPYSWELASPSDLLSLSSRTGATTTVTGALYKEGQIPTSLRVSDSAGASARYDCALSVKPIALPGIEITTTTADLVDATLTSSPLVGVTLRLASPLPYTITGSLTVTGPTAAANLNRPGEAPFTIPAGETTQTERISLQRGTVAGSVQITISSLNVSGGPATLPSPAPSMRLTIPAQAPSFLVTASSSGGAITIVVTGYSTTRDIIGGTINFGAAGGATVEDGTIDLAVINISQMFASYFSSSTSNNNGFFKLTIPISIEGDTNAISTVTVSLRGSAGSSTSPAIPIR